MNVSMLLNIFVALGFIFLIPEKESLLLSLFYASCDVSFLSSVPWKEKFINFMRTNTLFNTSNLIFVLSTFDLVELGYLAQEGFEMRQAHWYPGIWFWSIEEVVTWRHEHAVAVLVHRLPPIRIVLLQQNCRFGNFRIMWL